MTQQDRDRLVALKKAKEGLITQREAADALGAKRWRRSRAARQDRNSARKPSCSKCLSFKSTSVSLSRRMICMEMQSVRL